MTIDLARVSFVGRDGAGLLRHLRARGVTVENASPLVTAQLETHPRRTR